VKKQNNKMRRVISAIMISGLSLSIVPAANSTSKTPSEQRKVEINERLPIAKPVAGRNRRRSKLPMILPVYPRANLDEERIASGVPYKIGSPVNAQQR